MVIPLNKTLTFERQHFKYQAKTVSCALQMESRYSGLFVGLKRGRELDTR